MINQLGEFGRFA